MSTAKSGTSVVEFIPEAYTQFMLERKCADRPPYAAFSPITDEAPICIFGAFRKYDRDLCDPPMNAGCPHNWGPHMTWEIYHSQSIRLHPLVLGETVGLQTAGWYFGMPTFHGELCRGLAAEQRTNPYYVASQIVFDPRKVTAMDWTYWWRPTGWLREERATQAVFGHNTSPKFSKFWNELAVAWTRRLRCATTGARSFSPRIVLKRRNRCSRTSRSGFELPTTRTRRDSLAE